MPSPRRFAAAARRPRPGQRAGRVQRGSHRRFAEPEHELRSARRSRARRRCRGPPAGRSACTPTAASVPRDRRRLHRAAGLARSCGGELRHRRARARRVPGFDHHGPLQFEQARAAREDARRSPSSWRSPARPGGVSAPSAASGVSRPFNSPFRLIRLVLPAPEPPRLRPRATAEIRAGPGRPGRAVVPRCQGRPPATSRRAVRASACAPSGSAASSPPRSAAARRRSRRCVSRVEGERAWRVGDERDVRLARAR